MAFPNLTDYKNAVANSQARFASLDAVPVNDKMGNPLFLAGNFAGVFKMTKADGTAVAVKCFTRSVPDLEKRYGEISHFAKNSGSPYFIGLDFLPDELFVTSKLAGNGDYPVLCMPWIEARSIGAVVALLCERDKRVALSRLTQAWARICLDLLARNVAHGDLKQDNVLVTQEGRLRLIDYDSMFLPKLKGLRSIALGSPNFQHPGRDETHYDESMDHVSMLTILLTLRFLVFEPQAFAQYFNGENILFKREDFQDPGSSELMRQMRGSSDLFISDWAKRLERSCAGRDITVSGLKAVLNAATRLDANAEQPGLKWFFYRRVA